MGDGAQAGKPSVDARHEHDQAIRLSRGQNRGAGSFGVDGDGDRHVRQDDALIQRQQG